MIYTKFDAIQSLAPNSHFAINNDDIIWINNPITISETQIENEIKRLQAEYDAKEYQRKRAAEYPPIQEQMDMQYWDSVNGTTTWQDAIDAVKAKYPKPEGV